VVGTVVNAGRSPEVHMVRGLIVRQVFIVLDVVLAVALLGTGAMALSGLFAAPLDASRLPLDGDGPGARFETALRTLDGKSGYRPILDNRLFGDAGAFDPTEEPPPPPPPPPVEEPEVETSLNLRLVGTTDLRPFESAIIEDMDTRGSIHSFRPGELVVDKVTLEEVRQREVVIMNERLIPPKRELLRMDDDKGKPIVTARAPQRPAPQPAVDNSPDRITLNRNEFIQDLYTNYADLITKVRPEMYRDESGNVIGVTAQNISEVPMAAKLGLEDGDVLQSVNNEPIDSEQKIMEMVQKYQNSNSFRIGIMRNGQVRTITYRLQ